MKSPMYTLRRLLALVLVLVMVGSLFAGCNKKEPDPTDPPAPSETTQQTDAPTDAPTEAPSEAPTEAPTEPVVTEPPVIMGTVNADNLNVRNEPYTTGTDILKRLPINSRIEILEQKIVDGINWGRITEGWVNLNYVTIDGEGTGTGNVIVNNNTIENGNNTGTTTGTNTGSTQKPSTGTTTGTNNTVVSNGNKIALGTGTVKDTTSLAVRTGPGVNYAMKTFITLGETFPYYQKSGNWIRLQKGWVNSKYMALEYAIASGTEGTVNTGELNVRESADDTSKSLTTLKKDTKVTIWEVKGVWGKIEYETNKFGWINLDYVKFATASSSFTIGEYVVTAEGLNYRKEANADSTSLGTYKKNDKVTVTEIAGNWGKTDKGWINLKYTSMTAQYAIGTGTVTASSLNIRDKASTSGKDIGSYSKGDKVTITEVSGDWGKTDKGWISLKYVEMDPTAKYAVTVGTITGGKVEVSSSSYAKGSTVTLTITPDSGKELTSLTYTPEGGSAVAISGNKFTMPAAKVTINATFGTPVAKYTVTLNTGTGGKVTANTTTNITAGTEIILTVTPDTNYVLKSLSVLNTTNNQDITASVSGGKFTMPAGNVNVVAEFEKPSTPVYTLTTSSSNASQGTVSANTSSAVENADITLTINPASGYQLDTLTVKNATANANITPTKVNDSTYTFKMPAGNVTVTATFKTAEYAVNVSVATAGTGSASANYNTCAAGTVVTITVTPAEGYEFDKVTANTKDIEGKEFQMPASVADVVVTFKKIQYAVTATSSDTSKGTVKADKATAGIGDEVTLTIEPKEGFELESLTYTPEGGSAVAISGNKFTMPAKKVTVNATFKAVMSRTITVTVHNASGNPIPGAKVTINPISGGVGAAIASATANESGVATFSTSALKDIAIGTKLVAEPGDGYAWESGHPLRTGSASNGLEYTTDSDGNGYLTVENESFVGAFTIKIKSN